MDRRRAKPRASGGARRAGAQACVLAVVIGWAAARGRTRAIQAWSTPPSA